MDATNVEITTTQVDHFGHLEHLGQNALLFPNGTSTPHWWDGPSRSF